MNSQARTKLVKNNKRRGHQAEIEIEARAKEWPAAFRMMRTGLDGGHDLRGFGVVGEVKSVKAGPVWLKDGLGQLDNSPEADGFLFVKLGAGSGKGSRWLAVMDVDLFERLIKGFDDGRLTRQEV